MDNKKRWMNIAMVVGVLFVLVGVFMAGKWSQSAQVSGKTPFPPSFSQEQVQAQTPPTLAVIKEGVQQVALDLKPSAYGAIVVQKGLPVKFNIRADKNSINSCNGTVVLPEFNVQKDLKSGDNVMEFTPDKSGSFAYSCWMGMITDTIYVVDDLNKVDLKALALPGAGQPRKGCCQR